MHLVVPSPPPAPRPALRPVPRRARRAARNGALALAAAAGALLASGCDMVGYIARQGTGQLAMLSRMNGIRAASPAGSLGHR